LSDKYESELASDHRQALDRLLTLIRILKPLNRQVIVSYLEGMDAASIGEVRGYRRETWRPRFIVSRASRFHGGGAMTNEVSPNDARNVWQVQADRNASMSLEFRKEIGNLERVVRKRNAVGGSACFVVMTGLACFSLSFRI
jgi:hypothetical protein